MFLAENAKNTANFKASMNGLESVLIVTISNLHNKVINQQGITKNPQVGYLMCIYLYVSTWLLLEIKNAQIVGLEFKMDGLIFLSAACKMHLSQKQFTSFGECEMLSEGFTEDNSCILLSHFLLFILL